MVHKHDGGPAFPFGQTDSMSGQLVNGWGSEGMTLRDYLAAKVIQGICASGPDRSWSNDMLACEAYRLADAMLKARKVNDNLC